MIVIHHNDLDGKCAAAIVGYANENQDIRFIEADYKDEIDLSEIKPQEEVVIVDFSLKEAIMNKVKGITSNIIWIDHHVSAKDYPYQDLAGLRNFKEKEKSGCELAWDYYFPNKQMPLAVQLIGDYDKWALKLPDLKAFYEGMKIYRDTSPESLGWRTLFSDDSLCEKIIERGKIALAYRDSYCESLNKSFGFETEIDGIKAYASNQAMFGSGGFGDKIKQYPVCIGFIFDGSKYTISFYSETLDVAKLVVKIGKQMNAESYGGHAGASGMVAKKLPFERINK